MAVVAVAPRSDDAVSTSSHSSGDEREDSPGPESGNEDDTADMAAPGSTAPGNPPQKKPGSSKANRDPSRPKRKKARRACLACQTAHLTCSDIRPCPRCVDRKLGDSCHDGHRKKAKYLRDTPNEVLRPSGIVEGGHQAVSTSKRNQALRKSIGMKNDESESHDIPIQTHSQGLPYSRHNVRPVLDPSESYDGFLTRPPPNLDMSQYNGQEISGEQGMIGVAGPRGSTSSFVGGPFDAHDPTMFNFDVASMNFGNHYGALEFGMLGHLSAGAGDPMMSQRHGPPAGYDTQSVQFVDGPDGTGPFTIGHDIATNDWSSSIQAPIQLNAYNAINSDQLSRRRDSHGSGYAYAIGHGPGSFSAVSPASITTDFFSTVEQSATDMNEISNNIVTKHSMPYPSPVSTHRSRSRQGMNANSRKPDIEAETLRKLQLSDIELKLRRKDKDVSKIYTSNTKAYPYTAEFHALTAVLHRRFSPSKRLAIAKALASIRPSFISLTRTLIQEDLVFMEKCFQRQLVEYKNREELLGTPTLVCRRTGKIASVNPEFSWLTGWPTDVLLGKSPNLNVNSFATTESVGDSTSGAATTVSSRGGFNTPKVPGHTSNKPGLDGPTLDGIGQEAVFLSELQDDASVLQFFEDFSRHAFADTKGISSTPCTILKYITKEKLLHSKLPPGITQEDSDNLKADSPRAGNRNTPNGVSGRMHIPFLADSGTSGEIQKLSENARKVSCQYCWTIKRDVFDIPMLIVFNFLPRTS